MLNAKTHDEELAEADRHIAEAESRVLRQHRLIARIAADHFDTTAAEAVLAALQQHAAMMHEHRQRVLAEIARKPPE
jgi:hypothetical protein